MILAKTALTLKNLRRANGGDHLHRGTGRRHVAGPLTQHARQLAQQDIDVAGEQNAAVGQHLPAGIRQRAENAVRGIRLGQQIVLHFGVAQCVVLLAIAMKPLVLETMRIE